jgi:hypothetical protein
MDYELLNNCSCPNPDFTPVLNDEEDTLALPTPLAFCANQARSELRNVRLQVDATFDHHPENEAQTSAAALAINAMSMPHAFDTLGSGKGSAVRSGATRTKPSEVEATSKAPPLVDDDEEDDDLDSELEEDQTDDDLSDIQVPRTAATGSTPSSTAGTPGPIPGKAAYPDSRGTYYPNQPSDNPRTPTKAKRRPKKGSPVEAAVTAATLSVNSAFYDQACRALVLSSEASTPQEHHQASLAHRALAGWYYQSGDATIAYNEHLKAAAGHIKAAKAIHNRAVRNAGLPVPPATARPPVIPEPIHLYNQQPQQHPIYLGQGGVVPSAGGYVLNSTPDDIDLLPCPAMNHYTNCSPGILRAAKDPSSGMSLNQGPVPLPASTAAEALDAQYTAANNELVLNLSSLPYCGPVDLPLPRSY